MKNNPNLRAVADKFAMRGDFQSGAPYGTGHINDTYCIIYNQAGTQVRYILQRVNRQIFADIPQLMRNIERVCAHTRKVLYDEGCSDASRRTLTLVPTRDGKSFLCDADGEYWRVYFFIEGATGHEVIANAKQAYEAARAFGEFQKLLVDLPGERLTETIPNLHNTPKRFADLQTVLADPPRGRAESCAAEIDWALEHRELADGLLALYEQGSVPERVTHNDTKLNNVLIDDCTDEAVCVIDLDTVMPGLALYDFGDMVRSSTSPVAEDEQDLSQVVMQMDMYHALVRGYLAGAGQVLNGAEVENLPLAGMVLTFECGIRFLADYLAGDLYFKTQRPRHNLDRCRTQFKLVESMLEQEDEMRQCAVDVRV